MKKLETPEHDKLHAIREKSQAIGEFLDWLTSSFGKGLVLAREHEHDAECYPPDKRCSSRNLLCDCVEGVLYPARVKIEKLLAEYFKIDLEKLENEKRAILKEIRRES